MTQESRYLWMRVGCYVLAIIAIFIGAELATSFEGHAQAAGAVILLASFLYLMLSVMIHD